MVLFVLVWCPVNFVDVDFFIADPTFCQHNLLNCYNCFLHKRHVEHACACSLLVHAHCCPAADRASVIVYSIIAIQ